MPGVCVAVSSETRSRLLGHLCVRAGGPLIPILAAGSLLALTSPASADDECNLPVGGSVTCTVGDGPFPTGISYDAGNSSLELIIESGVQIEVDFTPTTNDVDGIDLDGEGVDAADLLRVEARDGVSITAGGINSDGLQVHADGGNTSVEIVSAADITVSDYGGSNGIIGRIDDGNGNQTTSTGSISIVQLEGSSVTVSTPGAIAGLPGVGIYGINYGLGAVSIEANGSITVDSVGWGAYGISGWANNADATGDVDIVLGGTGQVWTNADEGVGIYALNSGSGGAAITVSGGIETLGSFADGAIANVANAGSSAIASVAVTETGEVWTRGDFSYGVWATNSGVGDAIISHDGTVRSDGYSSIGLVANALQSGASLVTVSGDVTASGELAVGIQARSSQSTATVILSETARILGGWDGIDGEKAAGVTLRSLEGSTLINAGTILAGSDRAIADLGHWEGASGALVTTNSGHITGYIELADVAGNGFTNTAGGLFDVRHFADTDGDGVRDTKRVAISDFGNIASSFENQAGATVRLAVIDGNGPVTVEAGGYYVPTTGITDIPLEPGFYDLTRAGIVQGQFVNLGTFLHAGLLDLRGPQIGNTLVITGNPVAGGDPGAGVFVSDGGVLLLNTVLNAGVVPGGGSGSYSDVLIVDGTELGSGPTRIIIDRREGSGAPTPDNGILLVEVRDAAASAADVFTLQGDYVADGQQRIIGGLYSYALFHNGVGDDAADGNWYLRNVALSPNVPVYQEYPKVLVPLIELPTLQQRVGNRHWTDPASPPVAAAPAPVPAASDAEIFCKDPSQNFLCPVTPEQASYYADMTTQVSEGDFISEGGGFILEGGAYWGRIEGSRGHFEAADATLDTEYDATTWRAQAGIDALLHESDGMKLIGGVSVHYGEVSGDVDAPEGSGEIEGHGYGVGGSLTWYTSSGLYVDAQAQATWISADIRSTTANAVLVEDNHGFGYAVGLEVGYRHAIDDRWSLTPQAQLIHSGIDFDTFTDPFGARVALLEGDSLRGRLGVAAELESRWLAEDGTTSRTHVYGIADLYHEFLDGYRVAVADGTFSSRDDRLWGGIGIGGTYNWANDNYSIFGETSVSTSLGEFGDSHQIAGTVGLRVKW